MHLILISYIERLKRKQSFKQRQNRQQLLDFMAPLALQTKQEKQHRTTQTESSSAFQVKTTQPSTKMALTASNLEHIKYNLNSESFNSTNNISITCT